MSELPEGWRWALWKDLGVSQNGRPFPSSAYSPSGVKLLRPGNLHASGDLVWNAENTKFLPEEWATENADLVIGPEEIVMNLTAQSLKDQFLGRVCLSGPNDRSLLNQRLARLKPKGLTPRFTFWLFKSPQVRAYIDKLNTGSLIQHMFTSQVDKFLLPVPPLVQQHAIVEKIEAVTGHSRRAKAALDTIPPLLEKLRQSILAAAFRGDLTAEWRKKNPDVEPADKLLARIRIERRKKWEEAELAKMKAKGKTPTDERWRGKYEGPAGTDASGRPELPAGWEWASVDELTTDIVDCLHRTPAYVAQGIPAIRTADVVAGRLLLDQARRVTRLTYEEQIVRLIPKEGDILYSREGERFGLAALVPPGVELCMAQRMMQLRVVPSMSAGFVMWALNSPIGYQQAVGAVGGSTSPHVNIRDIRAFFLPIAPANEQDEVGRLVAAAMASITALESLTTTTANQLSPLSSALLHQAFSGEMERNDYLPHLGGAAS